MTKHQHQEQPKNEPCTPLVVKHSENQLNEVVASGEHAIKKRNLQELSTRALVVQSHANQDAVSTVSGMSSVRTRGGDLLIGVGLLSSRQHDKLRRC